MHRGNEGVKDAESKENMDGEDGGVSEGFSCRFRPWLPVVVAGFFLRMGLILSVYGGLR